MKFQPLDFEKPIAELEQKLEELRTHSRENNVNLDPEVRRMESKIEEMKKHVYSNLTAWQRVQIARHTARPFSLDYLQLSFSDFIELHGDRRFADDASMPGGLATVGRHRCAVIGHQKGRDTKENIRRNFGCANPEGYRKALRLMRMAEKFELPVFTFVDTPGAYPGIDAEERGQSAAIAENLIAMATLRTPIVAIVIGEGGSGGALAIGVADRLIMLQYSTYSVISPEGCASILWKSAEKAEEAATAMGITSTRLRDLGLIDEVIEEPLGGAHRDVDAIAQRVGDRLAAALADLSVHGLDRLIELRSERLRKYGQFKVA